MSTLNYYAPQSSKTFYPCLSCFPSFAETVASKIVPLEKRYVNLLDFPKFGGVSGLTNLSNFNTESMPFNWFADLRYTWNMPLMHQYPSVYGKVLESNRLGF